jgi:hypothetical protein
MRGPRKGNGLLQSTSECVWCATTAHNGEAKDGSFNRITDLRGSPRVGSR